MKKILFIILMATCTISISAQKKNVIIDVSHDVDTIYAYVNPNIFNLYKDIVEKQMGANLIINKEDAYQVNELVSRDHREKLDLNSFEERIYRALRSIFGAELDDVHIGDRFYAYKLKRRLATRQG